MSNDTVSLPSNGKQIKKLRKHGCAGKIDTVKRSISLLTMEDSLAIIGAFIYTKMRLECNYLYHVNSQFSIKT